jgi:hypothetical protein
METIRKGRVSSLFCSISLWARVFFQLLIWLTKVISFTGQPRYCFHKKEQVLSGL